MGPTRAVGYNRGVMEVSCCCGVMREHAHVESTDAFFHLKITTSSAPQRWTHRYMLARWRATRVLGPKGRAYGYHVAPP